MLFASSNPGKIKEVRQIFKQPLQSLNDLDIKITINENGKTFLENAIIKAKTIYQKTKIPTIADDSGLEIIALDGFPGVHTHRFLGEGKNDQERNQAILEMLKNKSNRTCFFTCAIAFYDGINLITKESRLQGTIAKEEHINNGFGFDSIFLYHNTYLSDMNIDEKNKISPRNNALLQLKEDKFFQKNIDFNN